MNNIIGLVALSRNELINVSGGLAKPNPDTSSGYDVSYYVVTGARYLWDGFMAFRAGVRAGSSDKIFYK